jgi:hypothetical protein
MARQSTLSYTVVWHSLTYGPVHKYQVTMDDEIAKLIKLEETKARAYEAEDRAVEEPRRLEEAESLSKP